MAGKTTRRERDSMGEKEAALALGYVTAEDFDRWVRPSAMIRPE